jgi:serine/threonine-protein kinase
MSKIFSITEGLENMGALRTGGQGSVYKARRMGPIISAVKILPTPIYSADDDDKNFRNFQNEVEKLKKVNEVPSPNVVKILNAGLTTSGALPYIEMEFIEGPDLEELLKPPHEKIFTIKETIKLADHLANALAHCHRVGVKHGDVKSNNVKYNIHSGNYILLDFGLSVMSDEQRRTSIRQAGAIEFMAPEQNTGAMLFQTDIYSFGIILYELLAGQVPFPLRESGETLRNAVMIAHMESPVPDLLTLRKKNMPEKWSKGKQEREMHVPQWLLQLIATCLEKEPEKRYSNGIALQEALLIGSIEASHPDLQNEDLPLLQAENEVLAARLENYRLAEENAKKQIHISKRYFGAIIAALILIMALGSYGVFTKSHIFQPQKQDSLVNKPVSPSGNATVPAADSTRLAGQTQTPPDTNSSAVNKPPTVNHPKKKSHKPKRKKFLGIF